MAWGPILLVASIAGALFRRRPSTIARRATSTIGTSRTELDVLADRARTEETANAAREIAALREAFARDLAILRGGTSATGPVPPAPTPTTTTTPTPATAPPPTTASGPVPPATTPTTTPTTTTPTTTTTTTPTTTTPTTTTTTTPTTTPGVRRADIPRFVVNEGGVADSTRHDAAVRLYTATANGEQLSTARITELQRQVGVTGDGVIGSGTRNAVAGAILIRGNPAGNAPQRQAALGLSMYLFQGGTATGTVRNYQILMGGVAQDGVPGPQTYARMTALFQPGV